MNGAPAAWDSTPPRLHRAGEATDTQINAQLDRYLLRWLAERDKTVADAIELPGDLNALSPVDLTTYVRRCAQALLRADKVAAASHPDAVNRVL